MQNGTYKRCQAIRKIIIFDVQIILKSTLVLKWNEIFFDSHLTSNTAGIGSRGQKWTVIWQQPVSKMNSRNKELKSGRKNSFFRPLLVHPQSRQKKKEEKKERKEKILKE